MQVVSIAMFMQPHLKGAIVGFEKNHQINACVEFTLISTPKTNNCYNEYAEYMNVVTCMIWSEIDHCTPSLQATELCGGCAVS